MTAFAPAASPSSFSSLKVALSSVSLFQREGLHTFFSDPIMPWCQLPRTSSVSHSSLSYDFRASSSSIDGNNFATSF